MDKDYLRTYHSSDYIGGDIGGHIGGMEFYYGYEVTDGEEWCFQVKQSREVIIKKTFTELGASDMFNLEDCFIRGMMLYIQSIIKEK